VKTEKHREALDKIKALIDERNSQFDEIMKVDEEVANRTMPMNDQELQESDEYETIIRWLRSDPKLTEKKVRELLKKQDAPFDELDIDISDMVLSFIYRNSDKKNLGRKGAKNKQKEREATIADLVADFLKQSESKYLLRFWRGDWYEYRSKRGYVQMSAEELEARLAEYIAHHEEYCDHGRHQPIVKEMVFRMKSFLLCGVPEVVKMPSLLYRNSDNYLEGVSAPHTYCFKDKIVNIMHEAEYMAKLRDNVKPPIDVDEDYWSLDKTNYEYKRESYEGRMPIFQKFLDETLDEQGQMALQEMFGVCVSDETKWERFWFLSGDGGTGKGVTTSILSALVGESNICNVMIDKMTEDFSVYPITECKVNIMGDMQEFNYGALSEIEGMLKNVTGKDAKIDVNKKFKDVERNQSVRARFVFTTNHLPGFVDRSQGIWRRLIIIPYPDKPLPDDKRDTTLAERIIKSELPYIMNWALEGLANVLVRDYPMESEQGKKKKKELQKQNNHEQQFLIDSDITAGCSKMSVNDLYTEYKDWMRNYTYHPVSVAKFMTRVCKLIEGAEVRFDTIHAKKTQCFVGVSGGELCFD
jgi:P4 family phage/plasmid primase-like protien